MKICLGLALALGLALIVGGCAAAGGGGSTEEAALDVQKSMGKGGATPDPNLPAPAAANGGPVQPPGNPNPKFKLTPGGAR